MGFDCYDLKVLFIGSPTTTKSSYQKLFVFEFEIHHKQTGAGVCFIVTIDVIIISFNPWISYSYLSHVLTHFWN